MASLTPEQLAQLQALNAAGNSGWSPYGQFSQDGQTYAPMMSYGQGMDNVGNNDLQGYMSYDPSHMKVGDQFQAYGKDGADAGMRQFQNATPISDFLIPLGAALAMGTFLPGMTGGAGAGGLGAAVDPMMYGGSGAGTWGTGAASAGAGGGYTMGSELFPEMSVTGGSSGLGLEGLAPIGSAAAGGGGVLSALGAAGGALGKYGGLLAAGLGALGGSQGVNQKTTTDKSPWAPMIPFLMNDQGSGLFNRAQGLLDRSFSPDQMTQNDWMRQHAVGLLMPQQQANFSRFFPGH